MNTSSWSASPSASSQTGDGGKHVTSVRASPRSGRATSSFRRYAMATRQRSSRWSGVITRCSLAWPGCTWSTAPQTDSLRMSGAARSARLTNWTLAYRFESPCSRSCTSRRDIASLPTEARIPFAAHWDPAIEPVAPAVDPARFRTGEPWPGHWAVSVPEWEPMRVEQLLARPSSARIEHEIAKLPRRSAKCSPCETWRDGRPAR